jgi:Zn-dependent M16 (insulinase) family peptidase
VTDPLRLLSFEVLTEVLVGNEGAALHKAVLESKLGDDLSPATGLETELNELVFTVGLRGVEERNAEAVQQLVLSTLGALAEDGIPEDLVQAALHRVEFRNSEIQRGGRPYSLTLMRRALRGWLHGTDPHTTLEFRETMDALRHQVAAGGYFEWLIRDYLVENSHRSTVVVRPDPDQQRREREEEQREFSVIREGWGPEAVQKLEAELRNLKHFQEQPDSPEVSARIPALHLEDLRREVETVPTVFLDTQRAFPLLYHDLFTNGVVYLDLAFDAGKVDPRFQHLVPLFSRAVRGSGVPGVPYYDMARRLSLYTGGFGASLSADTGTQPGSPVQERLFFRVKMLEQNVDRAIELVGELLRGADFRDYERLKTIILEIRNDFKASLVPGGSHYATLRAASRLSAASKMEEQWKGVSQFIWLDDLGRRLDSGTDALDRLAGDLESLRASLLAPASLTVNLACEQGAVKRSVEAASALAASLGQISGDHVGLREGALASRPPSETTAEMLVGSMNVSFVAHAIPASRFGSRENAYEAVLAHFLTTGFLWERIRVGGGAYGARATPSGLEALFSFSTYRDPNTSASLAAFREALLNASRLILDRDEFEKVVLGAAGKEDRPMAPGEKSFVALKRSLLGITDEQRQARRDTLIACTPAQLRSAAATLLSRFDRGVSVFLTYPEAVQRDMKNLEAIGALRLDIPG